MKELIAGVVTRAPCFISTYTQERLTSPGQDTPERKVFLEAVRGVVEQKLNGDFFSVSDIRAYQNWGKKFDIQADCAALGGGSSGR